MRKAWEYAEEIRELKRHRHTGDIVQRRLLEHAQLELIESGIGRIPVAVEDRAARDSWVARHECLPGGAGFRHDAEEAHGVVVLLKPYPIPEGAAVIDFKIGRA